MPVRRKQLGANTEPARSSARLKEAKQKEADTNIPEDKSPKEGETNPRKQKPKSSAAASSSQKENIEAKGEANLDQLEEDVEEDVEKEVPKRGGRFATKKVEAASGKKKVMKKRGRPATKKPDVAKNQAQVDMPKRDAPKRSRFATIKPPHYEQMGEGSSDETVKDFESEKSSGKLSKNAGSEDLFEEPEPHEYDDLFDTSRADDFEEEEETPGAEEPKTSQPESDEVDLKSKTSKTDVSEDLFDSQSTLKSKTESSLESDGKLSKTKSAEKVKSDETEEGEIKESGGQGSDEQSDKKTLESEGSSESKRSKRGRKPTKKSESSSSDIISSGGSPKRTASNEAEDEPSSKKQRKTKEPLLNQVKSNLNFDIGCTKLNANCQLANMKMVSWNVGGLRAAIKKDGMAYLLKEDADIVCLQEVRCAKNELPPEIEQVEGYFKYWHDCASKPSYAGCAFWSKVEPLNVTYGIEGVEEDEGRAIIAEYQNFYAVCLYVPNAGRKLVSLPKRLDWNKKFLAHMKKLDELKPIIISGDMNVAHNEIDLANPKTNTKNAGFTVEERQGMTEFLEAGFIDTFRQLYPDSLGKYTFWTYMGKARSKNIGWRLDYFIVSERLLNDVCDSGIRDTVYGSDHCPIVLWMGN